MNDSSFTDRIKTIISLVSSADKLAYSAGMSPSLIGKYLSGKTDPTRKKLIALAKAAEVNIEWLATGNGPMREGDRERFSFELLTVIIEGLDDLETTLGKKLTHKEKAEIISNTYDLYADADPATKILIKDTIKEGYNFLSSLDRMIETEKGRTRAIKIFTRIFGQILSGERAEWEASEFIGARLLKLRLK